MKFTNKTGAVEFLLLGLSEDPKLQPILFGLFLSVYLVTVLGNLLITLAISCDSHLHMLPMYFFLSNLSFVDICLITTTIPQMLVNIHGQNQRITYPGCLTQASFAVLFSGWESCLLAVMSYDRYAAICHPLRYKAIMNPHLCILLILLSMLISIMNALSLGLVMGFLSFCTDLKIPHFFCELTQIINLACSDTFISNIVVHVAVLLFGGIPFSGIIFSYTEIVFSILKISSARGKYKAFSTCGSHLSVVSLFYVTGLGVYISSAVTDSPRKTAVASVMYTVVPQLMNPYIYSLRNRDMKEALRKLFSGMTTLQ